MGMIVARTFAGVGEDHRERRPRRRFHNVLLVALMRYRNDLESRHLRANSLSTLPKEPSVQSARMNPSSSYSPAPAYSRPPPTPSHRSQRAPYDSAHTLRAQTWSQQAHRGPSASNTRARSPRRTGHQRRRGRTSHCAQTTTPGRQYQWRRNGTQRTTCEST